MNIQTLTDKINNDPVLNNLVTFFSDKIYLVGGSVRDALLGKDFVDRDLIVVDVEAKDFAKKVAEFFDATFITLDEENKIYRVVLKDKVNYLDITNPVGGNLSEDIFRRDLTINAIAVDIRTGEIPEVCFSCVDDLKNKKIRGFNEGNFLDDPLRLLRVFRFYSLLGFEIDEALLQIMKKHNHLLELPAKERIQYELMKLFSGKFCHEALRKMDEVGILELLFPFVKELKQVPPNLHHHLDLFNHSIEVVRQVGLICEKSNQVVVEHMNKVDFGGASRLAHLRLASFMHDIGKFSTWSIEEDTGRHRFIKHEDVGAKMCVPILKKMCFSNKQIEYVSYIIKKHMYPSAVVSAPDFNDKVKMRYVRKSEDNAIDNILIAKADRLSALGPEITQQIVDENISSLESLLSFYINAKDSLKPVPKLLDGNDVMKLLGIKPSPRLGEILDALYEAQISGDINTRDEAINFVKTFQ